MEIDGLSLHLDSYDMADKESFLSEKTFNVLGYVPILCIPSGVVRSVYGFVQVVVGIAVGTLHLIGDLFRSTPKGYGYRTLRNYEHVIHGIANVIRGSLEAGTAIGLPGMLYDITGLRYSYAGELKYKQLEVLQMNQFSQKLQKGIS